MTFGVLLALLTSVSWALGNVFIQKSGRAVGPTRAMTWAMAAGLVLSAVCAAVFDAGDPTITPAVVAWALVAGTAGLIAYACLFVAFATAPLSIAVPLVSSWALVAALFSIAVLGERPGLGQIAGAAIVLAGVVLVSLGSARKDAPGDLGDAAGGQSVAPPDRVRPGAVLAGLGSALGFGVMVPSLGRVAPAVGEFGASALVYGVGLLLALPVAGVLRIDLRLPPRSTWGLVLATGVSETVGYVAIAFARRFAPMAVVTPVASLAAAITVVYAWVVLHERPHPLCAAGAVLACAGAVTLAL